MSTLPAQDVPGVLERARLIEACGFDTAGFPDTQTIYADPFIAMGAVAAPGSALRLVTSVSNPVTRHPSVTANAISGVTQLARGGAARHAAHRSGSPSSITATTPSRTPSAARRRRTPA